MQGARVAAVQQSTGLVGMEVQDKTVEEIRLILDNRGVHPYRHLETDDDIYNMAKAAMPGILKTLQDVRANDDYLNYEKTITGKQKKILEDTIDRYFAQPLTPNSAHALPGDTIVSYNCAGRYDGRAQPSVLCVYGMPPAMMHARVGCNCHSTAPCGHAGAPWHGGACAAPVHAAAYAVRTGTAQRLRATLERREPFNSGMSMDYEPIVRQLETLIEQTTFENIQNVRSIVKDIDSLRENVASLFGHHVQRFLTLEDTYVKKFMEFLSTLFRQFRQFRLAEPGTKQDIYDRFCRLFNMHTIILYETELRKSILMLEIMQTDLGVSLKYKLQQYERDISTMFKEMRDPAFKPSHNFTRRIDALAKTLNPDLYTKKCMTSVDLGNKIQRIKYHLFEQLHDEYVKLVNLNLKEEIQKFQEQARPTHT